MEFMAVNVWLLLLVKSKLFFSTYTRMSALIGYLFVLARSEIQEELLTFIRTHKTDGLFIYSVYIGSTFFIYIHTELERTIVKRAVT